nr:MAG TPA: hypothetical protein [Caudoviricetes sp.]
MPKSEYYEPKKLPGERPCPQILNDAEELYGLLLTAETMMTKVDKIRYNNRAVDQILDVIKEFVLAYDFEDDREIHLKRMCANVTVFIRTMRLINDRNIIHVFNPLETEKPDTVKMKIMEHLGKLDEGVTRRKNSIIKSRNKGTSGIAKQ